MPRSARSRSSSASKNWRAERDAPCRRSASPRQRAVSGPDAHPGAPQRVGLQPERGEADRGLGEAERPNKAALERVMSRLEAQFPEGLVLLEATPIAWTSVPRARVHRAQHRAIDLPLRELTARSGWLHSPREFPYEHAVLWHINVGTHVTNG